MFDTKIELFIDTVEQGSFSAAAKKNYISQSAVSQAISKLEAELGIVLFNRFSYRPTLTNAGKYYYDAVKQYYEEYAKVVKNAKKLSMKENKISVDMIPSENFGSGGAKFNQFAMLALLEEHNVTMKGNIKLAVEDNQVVFKDKDGNNVELECDSIVLSLGVRPNQAIVESFMDLDKEVIYIGDCNTRIGTLYNAVHTAHEAASAL